MAGGSGGAAGPALAMNFLVKNPSRMNFLRERNLNEPNGSHAQNSGIEPTARRILKLIEQTGLGPT